MNITYPELTNEARQSLEYVQDQNQVALDTADNSVVLEEILFQFGIVATEDSLIRDAAKFAKEFAIANATAVTDAVDVLINECLNSNRNLFIPASLAVEGGVE